ncbi:MAG: ABC transporter ATP-binding protein [Chloroflexi bacterium]|nr:ABC transporter ATP-binding protein [Chloroflexota bacterium]
MSLISVAHLKKTFGATVAVDGVDLSIEAGEVYGLVGSDGAGKTTTLRLLVGALKADAGQVSICGFDVHRQGEQARACIGYLSQRFSLYEDLSVLENIRFFAELRGMARDDWLPRCMDILEFVGLADFRDRRAGQLSGGMRQKLGLASALVTRPNVLLLDEPTTGVDPVTRQDFWQLVVRISSHAPRPAPNIGRGEDDRGVAVIITTPYMDEASRCGRVGFMRAGRIIAEGKPSELRSTLAGQILEVRGASLPDLRRSVAGLEGVQDMRAFGDKLHLRVDPGNAATIIRSLEETCAGSPLEARLIPPTLEDVFLTLSQGNGNTQKRVNL